MRRKFFISLLLAAITFWIYWPALHYDTVFYDDAFFTDHPQVQSGLNWPSFAWAMTGVVTANWHPVTTLSFVLTHQFFGTNAGAEHGVNVAFHAANAALLFLVLLQMTHRTASDTAPITPSVLRRHLSDAFPRFGRGRRTAATLPGTSLMWRCAIVAALFAWHPLRVESVAWIAERKDVMCAFFMLLTLWAWTRYVQKAENDQLEIAPSKFQWSYGLALICFGLSLMSKAMVVTLPFLLLLLDLWPLGRIQFREFRINQLKPLLVEKIPFFALTGVFCVVTFLVQRGDAATPSLKELGFGLRLENIIVSYLRYLAWSLWPTKLAIFYPFPFDSHFYLALWPGWQIGAGLLALVGISSLCLTQIVRRPYLAVGWFWYLGMMVPVIGFVQVGGQGMADRYTYLPLIGPVIALVWLVSEKWKLKKIFKPRGNRDHPAYRSQTSEPPRGGLHLEGTGPRALQKVILTLSAGTVLIALAVTTRHQLCFWKNTDSLCRHTIEVTGENPRAEYVLALGLEHQGNIPQAMVHYRNAMTSQPAVKEAFYAMGRLFGQQGQWDQAEQTYLAMLGNNPNNFESHLGLVAALSHLGRNSEAEVHLKAALETCPNSPDALNNLAWTLATCQPVNLRDGPRAVELAERACALTGYRETVMVGTLGAAYAEAGRFERAIATAQKACALAEATHKTELLNMNQYLLELYRQYQPYRETSQPAPTNQLTPDPLPQ